MFRWSIKKQIFAIVGLLTAVAVIICVAGLYAMDGIRASMDDIETTARRLAEIDAAAAEMNDVIIGVREVLLTDDQAKKRADRDELNRKAAQIDAAMKAIGAETRLVTEWAALEREWESHKVIVGNIVGLAMENTPESHAKAVEMLATQCNPTRKKEREILDDILAKQKGFFQAADERATTEYRQALIILLSAAGVGIILGLGLAWLTVARLSRELHRVIDDLSARAEDLDRIAGEVSQSSSSLAEASTEQAASLEETSATLEEMASMTHKNADNAALTSQSTERTVKLIDDGGRTVSTVTQAMAEISQSSEKIGQIIKTIEGIAFQTNLLALNAAVEAARAGEAGQGFAVVADEVRNLALRSAQAAQDTSELIQNTVQQVNGGVNNVNELAEGFRKIEAGAQEVGNLIMEITSATREQAQGAGQISSAVAEMDKMTQSNAAMAEESASSSTALTEQTFQLKDLVDQLYALVAGGSAAKKRPVRPAASGRGALPEPDYY